VSALLGQLSDSNKIFRINAIDEIGVDCIPSLALRGTKGTDDSVTAGYSSVNGGIFSEIDLPNFHRAAGEKLLRACHRLFASTNYHLMLLLRHQLPRNSLAQPPCPACHKNFQPVDGRCVQAAEDRQQQQQKSMASAAARHGNGVLILPENQYARRGLRAKLLKSQLDNATTQMEKVAVEVGASIDEGRLADALRACELLELEGAGMNEVPLGEGPNASTRCLKIQLVLYLLREDL
jgi:hypothetical protein